MVKSRINNTCQRGPEGGNSALRALVLGVRGTWHQQRDLALTYIPKMLHIEFGDDRTKTVAVYREQTDRQTYTHTDQHGFSAL